MASTEPNPLKRARTDEDSTEPEVTKDPELWLPDGNIVVISQNVAFRVHKSILARHSEVFRDLFTLPTEEVNETMEGCPLVHLDSDDPNDLKHLFLVVCGGVNYYYANDEMLPVSFGILASLIRMGHKYGIAHILNDALGRLKKYYPSDQATWLDVSGRAKHVTAAPLDAITAIELARLTDTPSIIPTAYLVCCDQIKTRDGTIVHRLDPEDASRVLWAHAALGRYAANRILSLSVTMPCPTCESPVSCSQASRRLTRARCLAIPVDSAWRKMDHRSVFAPLDDWFLGDSTPRPCPQCVAAVRTYDLEERTRLWKILPAILKTEVPDWPKIGA